MWLIGLAGCGHVGAWQIHHGTRQSISGPQDFARVEALGAPSSWVLMIECAPDGLQLALGGDIEGPSTPVRFDGDPVTLPLRTSRRGVPVIDLRAPISSGTTTEALLTDAERLTVHDGVEFDVTDADRAIRRLRCRTVRR